MTEEKINFLSQRRGKRSIRGRISCLNGGWFCKTCEGYSDSLDEYWKTLPRKHDEHPGMFFNEHANTDKHKKSPRNKQEVKIMLSKEKVVRQLTKGMENKTEKDRRKNRTLIKKFLKSLFYSETKLGS